MLKLDEEKLTTKGDANFDEDPPVAYDSVVGRTLTAFRKPIRIPYLGSITVFASNLRKP